MAIIWLLILFITCKLLEHSFAQYTPQPRWGQAATLIDNALLVHGGKSDPLNSYSYTSAPANNDILYLSLSSSFDTSSPAWQLVSSSTNTSTSQGPALAWHTLSAYNSTQILLFGGQYNPNSPTVLPGVADSAFLLNLNNQMEPAWVTEAVSWANEPIRRMRHTTSSAGGRIFLIGGEKVDGSGEVFSDHYVFDINIPLFTLLPSSNGPPDLYGHTSVVLDNGSLIVLGGYCGTQAALLPLTTIWMMDTTRPTLAWSTVSVSNASVPTPRLAFAAAPLESGKVIIHGGADAPSGTSYSDGWILDTTQNPMVWSQVNALSQLGPRRDHFAVASGSQVMFGFGYAMNAAAPAVLQVFDSSVGQWTKAFTPPPASPTNSVPGSSQTTRPGHGSPTSGSGQSSSAAPDSGDDSDDSTAHSTGLALGTTFGVLALIACGVSAVYLVRKRGTTKSRRFHMLGSGFEDDGGSQHGEGAIPTAVNFQENESVIPRWVRGMPFLKTRAQRRAQLARERRDMLADEDTRQFYYGLEGNSGSTWSLRNVGAMIGNRMGMKSREQSTSSTLGAPWREKSDPFSGAALMWDEESEYVPSAPATAALRSSSRRQQSYSSGRSYRDPFADPILEEDQSYNEFGGNVDRKGFKMSSLASQLPPLQTGLPLSTRINALSPVTEQSSRNTLTDASRSQDNVVSSFDSSSQTSRTSHGDKPSDTPIPLNPLHNAHPNIRPAQSIRRSNSWWARFSRTSFLDRRSSDAGKSQPRILDFRDPNPAPRLLTIDESANSMPASRTGSHSRQYSHLYGVGHGQSTTSLQTARTADTAMIEKLGVMDVVQRMMTPTHRTSDSTGSMSDAHYLRGDSDYPADKSFLIRSEQEDTSTIQSPTEMSPTESSQLLGNPLSPRTPPLSHNLFSESSTQKLPSQSGGVAARIQAYERRMSQDLELSSPPTSPGARNTRRREEKPRNKIISVNYGLAPRPSLYVANPDHMQGASSSSS